MSIKKNYLYNLIYQILIIILPFITSPYISRVIGAEGLGIYSYTYSVAYYFGLIILLGLNNYGNRSIAQVRDNKEQRDKVFSELYTMQSIMSFIVIIIYIGYVFIGNIANKDIAMIQVLYLLSVALDINWLFFGLEKFKITVTRNVVIKILSVCSIFIFVRTTNDLWKYTLIMTLGTLISQILLWLFIRKFNIKFKFPKLKELVKHIKPNLVLFIPAIAVSIYTVMDKIMLGNLSDMTQVGFYENAEKIKNIPMGAINALGTVMLPQMSNLVAKGEKEKSKEYMNNSMKFAMFMAVALTFGISGIANQFAPIFFGEEFKECGTLISYLEISVIFIAWANVIRTQYLIPNCQEKIYIRATIIGAILNFIINYTLIPKIGALGAVIGTIFAEGSVAVYETIKIRKHIEIRQYIKDTLVYVIAGVIMFFAVRVIGEFAGEKISTLVTQIITGGIIYLGICFICLYLKKDKLIMQILKKFCMNSQRHNKIIILATLFYGMESFV